ncbi:MAG: CoA transferase [Actinomycetota bacterium]|nr:CoA transferase [Actinomycetota bacterium]MDP2287073.1 CoA transferase [Actinomycetota bacterium]
MQGPMAGVRVVEVAQFTFVPSSGAVLADWGADVIKIEHAETGDAQRGLVRILGLDASTPGVNFFPIMEGPNRGKRSLGLTLGSPEANEILAELVRRADVFVTNFLPSARRKAGIDVDQIRAINPDIIYVRGTGFGNKGPERDAGGYDATGFWARGGSGDLQTAPEAEQFMGMPTGAYGDNIGGMTIAGGIAAALYKRSATGVTSIVDVSLLSVGAWATQYSSNVAMILGGPAPRLAPNSTGPRNPITGTYRTRDGRWITLNMLQPGKYWAEFCRVVGRQELVTDPRFTDGNLLLQNGQEGAAIVAEILASRTFEEWLPIFTAMDGQWSPVQNTWELSQDASLRANGLVAQVTDADGVARELIQSPVLFDELPPVIDRAPQFAEHTDEILAEIGISDERLIELKIAGIVT